MAISGTAIQTAWDDQNFRAVTVDGTGRSFDDWTTPTSGNLLVLMGVARHSDAGTASIVLPTGFNLIGKYESNISYRASFVMAWKVSDGTESSITLAFHPSEIFINRATMLVAEFPVTDLDTSAAADSAENETYVNSNTTSIAAGSVTNTVADALCIVGMGGYSEVAWDSTNMTVDNSYSIQALMDPSTISNSFPVAAIATKVVSSVAAQNPTFSAGGSGSGGIGFAAHVVFDGSNSPPTITAGPTVTSLTNQGCQVQATATE